MPEDNTKRKFGKKDWDDARLAFSNSLMVDTRLTSLAQNVELSDWPIKGENENPSKYIDFTWEEINELPGLAEYPKRIDLLISILKETLAFDDPFGEMVATVENATKKDDTLERTLAGLEIPLNCPLRFSALSPDTLDFCKAEGIDTVGAFATFSQGLAQNIVMGGDFKALLNALMAQDEAAIARYLPYRPQQKGLHLIEAVGLLTAQLSDSERYSLLRRYNHKLTDSQIAKARLSREQIAQLEEILQRRVRDMVDYFKEEALEIRRKMQSGTRLERSFVILNNEEREIIGSTILGRILKGPSAEVVAPPARTGGFFSKLFGRR